MNINQITNLLNNNNLSAKKAFGQNFLLDDNVIAEIGEKSNIDENTCVIEVGPGLGFLTKELIKRAKSVICYEVDHDMVNYLNKNFHNDNLTIIEKDFLKVSIDQDIEQYFKDYSKIVLVSNLPYYITTPILLKVLEESKKITSMTCMMQREVAQRICGKPSTKDYNALSVLIQYYTMPEIIINVSKEAFYPIPEVDSSVVSINYYEKVPYQALDEDYFKKFNRIIFAQRRKTLTNNLKSFGIKKEMVEEVLTENNLSLTIRAEALSIEQIVKLANEFYTRTRG